MKRILLFCMMAAMSFTMSYAQIYSTKANSTETNKVYTVVEKMPSFPGGDKALMDYLRNNIKYPAIAVKQKEEGYVVVGFIVECDGSITDIKVLRGATPSLDEEAIRVVKCMPKWIPGMRNDKKVRVRYQVPVSFRLRQMIEKF